MNHEFVVELSRRACRAYTLTMHATPSIQNTKQSAKDTKHSTKNTQQSTQNTEQSRQNTKQLTNNTKQSTHNNKKSTRTLHNKHSTLNTEGGTKRETHEDVRPLPASNPILQIPNPQPCTQRHATPPFRS